MNISNQVVDRLEAGTSANRAAIVRLAAGVSTNYVRLANLNARFEVLNRQLEAQRELEYVYDVLRNIMEGNDTTILLPRKFIIFHVIILQLPFLRQADNNLTLIEIYQSIRALLARAERVDSSNEVEERETTMDQ
jgi:hypothetical protein